MRYCLPEHLLPESDALIRLYMSNEKLAHILSDEWKQQAPWMFDDGCILLDNLENLPAEEAGILLLQLGQAWMRLQQVRAGRVSELALLVGNAEDPGTRFACRLTRDMLAKSVQQPQLHEWIECLLKEIPRR